MSAAASQGTSDGGDEREDRRTRSLQGLLNFCVENTKSEDAQGASSFTEMDPEDQSRQLNAATESFMVGRLNDPALAKVNQDKALAALGLYRFNIPGDGNCLFRAVSRQMGFDQESYHPILRRMTARWMREHEEQLFACGLLDDEAEIDETELPGAWPGQAAIVGLANIFSINIAVIQGGDQGDIDIQHISPFETPSEGEQGSMILAYLYNGHYDVVVDQPDLPNPEYDAWLEKHKARESGAAEDDEDEERGSIFSAIKASLKEEDESDSKRNEARPAGGCDDDDDEGKPNFFAAMKATLAAESAERKVTKESGSSVSRSNLDVISGEKSGVIASARAGLLAERNQGMRKRWIKREKEEDDNVEEGIYNVIAAARASLQEEDNRRSDRKRIRKKALSVVIEEDEPEEEEEVEEEEEEESEDDDTEMTRDEEKQDEEEKREAESMDVDVQESSTNQDSATTENDEIMEQYQEPQEVDIKNDITSSAQASQDAYHPYVAHCSYDTLKAQESVVSMVPYETPTLQVTENAPVIAKPDSNTTKPDTDKVTLANVTQTKSSAEVKQASLRNNTAEPQIVESQKVKCPPTMTMTAEAIAVNNLQAEVAKSITKENALPHQDTEVPAKHETGESPLPSKLTPSNLLCDTGTKDMKAGPKVVEVKPQMARVKQKEQDSVNTDSKMSIDAQRVRIIPIQFVGRKGPNFMKSPADIQKEDRPTHSKVSTDHVLSRPEIAQQITSERRKRYEERQKALATNKQDSDKHETAAAAAYHEKTIPSYTTRAESLQKERIIPIQVISNRSPGTKTVSGGTKDAKLQVQLNRSQSLPEGHIQSQPSKHTVPVVKVKSGKNVDIKIPYPVKGKTVVDSTKKGINIPIKVVKGETNQNKSVKEDVTSSRQSQGSARVLDTLSNSGSAVKDKGITPEFSQMKITVENAKRFAPVSQDEFHESVKPLYQRQASAPASVGYYSRNDQQRQIPIDITYYKNVKGDSKERQKPSAAVRVTLTSDGQTSVQSQGKGTIPIHVIHESSGSSSSSTSGHSSPVSVLHESSLSPSPTGYVSPIVVASPSSSGSASPVVFIDGHGSPIQVSPELNRPQPSSGRGKVVDGHGDEALAQRNVPIMVTHETHQPTTTRHLEHSAPRHRQRAERVIQLADEPFYLDLNAPLNIPNLLRPLKQKGWMIDVDKWFKDDWVFQ